MTNEISKLQGMSNEKLMSFVGQAPSTKPMIATLTTTKSGAMDDEKGNPIKGGLFLIEGTTHGIMIAETLLFRPLYSNYQYRKFDPDNKDNNCKSIMFGDSDWNAEKPDTNGTNACGSVPKKLRHTLDGVEAQEQKKVKCHKNLWGLVTATGVTLSGEEVSITEEPILYEAKGSNFMPLLEVIQGLSARNSVMSRCVLEFYGTEKRVYAEGGKNSPPYYVVKIKDTFKRKDLSDNDLQLITKFRETEKVENEYVMSKYKEKNKQKGDVLDDDIVAELESTK